MAIPARLIRTVPETTDAQTEAWWAASVALTPGWEHVTLRDPIDAIAFPITSPYWDQCSSGAQRAGLIRLEALLDGGLYIDSDVELWKDPTPLLDHQAFAAYEDQNTIPDAVMGFEPGHPALRLMIAEAVTRLADGAWQSGPGVSTRQLANRDDVTLLPTAWLYPYHWKSSVKRRYDIQTRHGRTNLAALRASSPETFMAHYWRHSWKPT